VRVPGAGLATTEGDVGWILDDGALRVLVEPDRLLASILRACWSAQQPLCLGSLG